MLILGRGFTGVQAARAAPFQKKAGHRFASRPMTRDTNRERLSPDGNAKHAAHVAAGIDRPCAADVAKTESGNRLPFMEWLAAVAGIISPPARGAASRGLRADRLFV